ncbi:MAG: RnfABCDGE type electron transport complex subunit D [Planctomycetota bacterium]|jgi:electron transport complex protein RnfD
METQLLVGSSPHAREVDSIHKIMWSVVGALAPAAAISIYFFGLRALAVYLISIGAAQAAELACLRVRGRPLGHASDGSALVTGMLLAMVLPPGVAWYCPLVGGIVAVALVKHAFGGLGNNIWNPALAARVFLQFAYPTQISLSQWPVPRLLWGAAPDAVATASPLAGEGATFQFSHLDLLFGNGVPGCIGETCKIALLAGGVFLILRRAVDWRIPLCYVGTVFLLTWILPVEQAAPDWAKDPLYHVLSGGLIIGAFFMATDMVTTPLTRRGRAVFGVGCGLTVALIRRYGGYPEGVAYSIVLMNTFTPLIDRWIRPRVYGSRTPKPAPREA